MTSLPAQIVVKKNAPNWPAMVAKQPIKSRSDNRILQRQGSDLRSEIEEIKNNCVASSLWLKKKYDVNESRRYSGLDSMDPTNNDIVKQPYKEKPSPFAPKVVRQCGNCQLLYSSYHTCTLPTES
jgi:hypothetical protein